MDETSVKEKIFKAVREALIEKDMDIIVESDTVEIVEGASEASISFADKFVSKGGGFLFCECSKDLLDGVVALFKNCDLTDILCLNDDLSEVLAACNIKHVRTVTKDQKIDFVVMQADALIANSGAEVVSFNNEFENIVLSSGAVLVLFARTDQVVNRYADVPKIVNSREHSVAFSYVHLIEKPATKNKLEFPKQTNIFLRYVK